MAGRLEGKVAFITGAARGQGRAHAIRMAQEGADIIAIDICAQIDSNNYPLGTPEDLAETERAVKELDRRIVARQADVRERSELRDALEAGITFKYCGPQSSSYGKGTGNLGRRGRYIGAQDCAGVAATYPTEPSRRSCIAE